MSRDLSGRASATKAVHGAERVEIAPAIPTVSPLHFSTSYVFESTEDLDKVFVDPESSYCYGRFGNPTIRAMESAIALLENAEAAIAYPSGMAAVNGVFQTFAKPGDTVVVSRDVYGATLNLLQTQFAAIGVKAEIVDVTDLDAVREAVDRTQPCMVYGETISNPLLKVADIAALDEIAHAAESRLVIDNTFASPALVTPLDLGADLVLHSTTKFIAGHGDVTGGVVSGKQDDITAMRNLARINGAVPGPMDAWLTTRGLKTLHIRLAAQCANARKLVDWLQHDPRISRVYYPGLEAELPEGQFPGENVCALVSFEVDGMDERGAFHYLEALQLIEPATTLGDVGTLTLYPSMSSHRGLGPDLRHEWGINDNLLRLSVGIEDIDDIIADLDAAIDAALSGDNT